MSLRMTVSGFDLSRLRSCLGSRDPAAVAEIQTQLNSDGEDWDEALRGVTIAVVRRAVEEGCPFPDLESEQDPHVFAAYFLAQHGQEMLSLTAGDWKINALWDTKKACRDVLSAEALNLLAHLCSGRALFGRRIESSWSFYAFLSCQEAATLQKGLAAALEQEAVATVANEMDGFIFELADWLEAIVTKGLDLWFWTA